MQAAGIHSVYMVVLYKAFYAVRAEDGCIHYDYYFSAKDENVVFLFEEWTSEHHQQVHLTQPHIAQLKQIKEKYILDTVLRVL